MSATMPSSMEHPSRHPEEEHPDDVALATEHLVARTRELLFQTGIRDIFDSETHKSDQQPDQHFVRTARLLEEQHKVLDLVFNHPDLLPEDKELRLREYVALHDEHLAQLPLAERRYCIYSTDSRREQIELVETRVASRSHDASASCLTATITDMNSPIRKMFTFRFIDDVILSSRVHTFVNDGREDDRLLHEILPLISDERTRELAELLWLGSDIIQDPFETAVYILSTYEATEQYDIIRSFLYTALDEGSKRRSARQFSDAIGETYEPNKEEIYDLLERLK